MPSCLRTPSPFSRGKFSRSSLLYHSSTHKSSRIGEKFLEWSDVDPPLSTILTNVSLYWFTSSFPRSIYPYQQLFGPSQIPPFKYDEKPTGFSFFPYELSPGYQSALEKQANLVFYKQHEQGGHFAALERPKDLFEDVEEYVGKVWKV